MKILKEGRRPQRGWAAERECTGRGNGSGGCGALLLIEQDDVFETDKGDRFATFRCPACGVWTDLEDWPPFRPRKKEPFRDGHASGEVSPCPGHASGEPTSS